ncbi:Cytochrome c [Lutibacter oricola]|uniref:Cytochrome c n=1 Tax=Lutibacter oricola TaxID=762486 RepID=A0A1H2XJJ3_9FLAO|nr:c-type cytochrome [Lutibacter oricola]SDW93061.1 Cytochrome c [Lutibacter oricola]
MKNVVQIKTIIFFFLIIIGVSCNTSKKDKAYTNVAQAEASNNEKGLELIKQKCYACHSVTSKSHDEIIAPPLVAVKRRYLRQYNSKEEFVKAVSNWIVNPTEEKAIMYGAVNQFKVMPKLPNSLEDAEAIATYMYNNNLEKPSWFQNHFNNEHSNKSGRGRNGKGKGNRF